MGKSATILLILCMTALGSDAFKNNQLKNSRVRHAYAEKEAKILANLKKHQIDSNKLNIYLRAFKSEQLIELWGKENTDLEYRLLWNYEICNSSGEIGPKRQQGDLQVPEGFYHINRFNPWSNYHLSLGINYPNPSDRILGNKNRLGGDIFIHGSCVTIGCLPITDALIEELYIYCVEAKNNGQAKIPVTIFPSKLSDQEYRELMEANDFDADKSGLWTDLKKGYDLFNETHQLPTIGFLNNGRHRVSAN